MIQMETVYYSMSAEASRLAVQAIADEFGISLTRPSLLPPIAQDAEFRVQQILTPAAILAKKSHRSRLTADHINMVLASMRIPPVLGYSSDNPFHTNTVSTEAGELCVVEDPVIELKDLVTSVPERDHRQIPFSFSWVLVDGIPIEKRSLRARFGGPKLLEKPSPFPSGNPSQLEPRRIFSDTPDLSAPLGETFSPDFRGYFDHMIQLFESDDPDSLDSCRDALGTDAGIQPLLPLFLHFLAGMLTRYCSETEFVRKVGIFAAALVENPSLPIQFYAHAFLRTAMTVLLRYESGRDIEEDLQVRRGGAELLVAICQRCTSGFPTIRTVVINTLIRAWLGSATTHAAQFGALVGIRAFGRTALRRIFSHISGYLVALRRELVFDDPRKKTLAVHILNELAEIIRETIPKLNRSEQQRFQVLHSDIATMASKAAARS
jgi:hypothetical protein